MSEAPASLWEASQPSMMDLEQLQAEYTETQAKDGSA